jgi:hypothetical protein
MVFLSTADAPAFLIDDPATAKIDRGATYSSFAQLDSRIARTALLMMKSERAKSESQ